jgi:hypothetical protein
MANFTAILGNLDFAQYLRVGPGDGLDPYAHTIEEPAFTEGIGDGQPLLNVDTKNREMSWPLHLKAATKDALHDLVRQLNLECQRVGVTLQWKDSSATNITYYTVTYARFEPDFDYRKADQEYVSGVLRVWCAPPYGTTGTDILVGTSIAATQAPWLASVGLPTVAGDALALANATVFSGTRATQDDRAFYSFIALVPSGWQSVLPAASLSSVATLVGASGTGGSQVARVIAPATATTAFSGRIYNASVNAGPNRVLMLARPLASGPGAFVAARNNSTGKSLGPTAILGATRVNDWALLDLGVINVDPYDTANSPIVQVRMAHASGASMGVEVNGLFTLPEGTTCLTPDGYVDFTSTAAASGVTSPNFTSHSYEGYPGRTRRQSNLSVNGAIAYDGNVTVIDHRRRGAIPKPAPSAAQALIAGMVHTGPVQQDARVSVTVTVRERFRFAR